MEDVERALNRKQIVKAQEALNRGKSIIKRRMKLIRLADREDWDTVREYVSDELASDTEDEKQIEKAIRVVSAKRQKFKRENVHRTSAEGRKGISWQEKPE